MNEVVFYILSSLAIFSTLMVIFSRNPMHSVLYLILAFFAIAGHYALLLNAQFLAAVHIIVYAGAVMVLFLYVIMMLNLNAPSEPHKRAYLKVAAVFCGGLLLFVLIGALRGIGALDPLTTPVQTDIGLVRNLGKALFTDFLVPFEISSILFLAAMVGVVMLGKKQVSTDA
ncbi:MAG: NADH-quinone oxidoreductase subunit J [Bacteroidota bacterium]|nr:NADH-quinone oxidoreductase subunit J [Bacteroidota bacterium]